MFPYIPNTNEDEELMLKTIGKDSVEELFDDIPKSVRLNKKLDLEEHKSEIEVAKILRGIADKNKTVNDLVCFLGAGAYDRYIPSVVKHITSRSEFYTSYTPYQAEISQGTLQAIFEYETMIANLTGMDVSNASMYDGATATAEAAIMACDITRRRSIIVSKTVHPEVRRVLSTYMKFHGLDFIEIDYDNGTTDIDKIREAVNNTTAAVIVQNPNFFGIIEDYSDIEKIAHDNKALLVMNVEPISQAVIKCPGEIGADIVTGEGQALGNSLNFGGPYLGFMATTNKYMRKLPGRIVGETLDVNGNRAFVLTLQAREQHIRREKASSNICSNESLNALSAAVYFATLGKKGIREVAEQSMIKAHYAFNKLIEKKPYKEVFKKPFFMEFVIKGTVSVEKINEELLNNNIIGGYDLGIEYPELKDSMLLCVTEKRTKEEINSLVKTMEVIK